MVSVKCADISCKYHSEHSDTCKAKKISLSWHSVVTTHDGRKKFLRCKQYEESEEYKRIVENYKRFLNA